MLRGVEWLVDRQLDSGPAAGSWAEEESTGTGFPRHFYIRYHMYRHYFPLLALQAVRLSARHPPRREGMEEKGMRAIPGPEPKQGAILSCLCDRTGPLTTE